ncbi:hypothetical protein MKEN_00125300 [Mycena kentingensis (nom. inval.)]|nr:hypothetical protein MKEN_00125300 [Mycena kentingensis (nom. inval.)]
MDIFENPTGETKFFAVPSNKKVCSLCRKSGDNVKTAHWKAHKPLCLKAEKRAAELAALRAADPSSAAEVELFGEFARKWIDALFAWGLFAANLPASTAKQVDYLSRHSFFVVIERRSNIPSNTPAKSTFELLDVGMRTNDAIIATFNRMAGEIHRQELATNFERILNAQGSFPNILRIVVVQPSTCLSYATVDTVGGALPGTSGTTEETMKWFKPESNLLATTLSSMWLKALKEAMAKGDTSAHVKLLKNVEDALGVD